MRAFDAHWAEAVAEIEAEFGERVRIEPRTTGGTWRGRPGTDATREIREVIARYSTAAAIAELEGNREGSKFQSMTRFGTATHVLRLSGAQIAALGYVPQSGDLAALLDRPGTPRFTVMGADRRAGDGVRLDMVSADPGESA